MASRLTSSLNPNEPLDFDAEAQSDMSGVRPAVRRDVPESEERPSVELFRKWDAQSVEELYARELAEAAALEPPRPRVAVPSRQRRIVLTVLVATVLLGALALLGTGVWQMLD